jgi:hypothetical protein
MQTIAIYETKPYRIRNQYYNEILVIDIDLVSSTFLIWFYIIYKVFSNALIISSPFNV